MMKRTGRGGRQKMVGRGQKKLQEKDRGLLPVIELVF